MTQGVLTPGVRLLWIVASAVTLGAAAALSLLAILHHLLSTHALGHFDSTVQAAVHELTRPSLTRLMLPLTWLGKIEIFAPALAAAVLWLGLRGRGNQAALLGGGIAGAFLLNETLKLHFHRARPHLPWSIGDEHTYSFPSGHSLFAVVLYGTLAYLALREPRSRRHPLGVLLPAILLPFSIGVSRIYLGMHYPTDVLAGWLAGGVWLSVLIIIEKAWTAHASRRPATQTPRNSQLPSSFR